MAKSRAVATSVLPVEQEERRDLNEDNIRSAIPGDTLWDAKIRGLHLRVFEGRMSFYVYYRTRSGAQRKPKIGDYGTITLSQARKTAQVMLAEVVNGGDPSKARQDARDESTLLDLWKEFRTRGGSDKKSASEDLRIWSYWFSGEKHPSRTPPHRAKMNWKLSEFNFQAIDDIHKSIKSPVAANRFLALLSVMFNLAAGPLKWIDSNPCNGVKKNRERKRRRYATPEEVARIAAALTRHDGLKTSNLPAVAFIKLLILTGARLGEIASARWDQVKGTKLVLPPEQHKTGRKTQHDRVIQLNSAAMEVLDSLPRTSGTLTGIQSPAKMWQVVRVEAKCPDLRIHDLRHSFASVAVGAGYNLAQIGELLGHTSTQTTQRYAHLIDEAAHEAADKIGERIGVMMAEKGPQGSESQGASKKSL
ncbi:site-specific integrase [Holophaga foetida]|uniref:site-specific integrase n=1 Tax=Holophaga foetida TaxID=35839 RepID=UPI000247495A|nr:site-specific integrase [Holophaga foetida]